MSRVLLINGPNLSRLGHRSPEIYGYDTLPLILDNLATVASTANLAIGDFQNNSEGKILDFIERNHEASGIIINPGALMMNGWALRDCLEDFPGMVFEVHISNVWAREEFRHNSILSPVVTGVIAGLGTMGYELALRYLINRLK